MRALRYSSFSAALHASLVATALAASALRVAPLPEVVRRPRVPPLIFERLPDSRPSPPAGGPSGRPAFSPAPAPGRPQPPRRREEIPATPQRTPVVPALTQPQDNADAATQAPPDDGDTIPAGAGGPIGPGGGDPNGTIDGEGGGGSGPLRGPGGGGGGSGDGDGDVLYIDGTIVLPQVVYRVEPIYPAAARQARLEATLRFQVVVDRNGDVVEVTPIKTHPLFERSAVEALRQWKYRPAMQAGKPVKVYLLVTVEFRLVA